MDFSLAKKRVESTFTMDVEWQFQQSFFHMINDRILFMHERTFLTNDPVGLQHDRIRY